MAGAIILTSISTMGDEIQHIYSRTVNLFSGKETMQDSPPPGFGNEELEGTMTRLLDDHLQCQIALHEKKLEVADLRSQLETCAAKPTTPGAAPTENNEENRWRDRLEQLE
jgi:hypothetical protein